MKKKINYWRIVGVSIILTIVFPAIYFSPFSQEKTGLLHHLTFFLVLWTLCNFVLLWENRLVSVSTAGALLLLSLLLVVFFCFFMTLWRFAPATHPDMSAAWILYTITGILLAPQTLSAVKPLWRKVGASTVRDGRLYYPGKTYWVNPLFTYPPDIRLHKHKKVFQAWRTTLNCNDGIYPCKLTTAVNIDLKTLAKDKSVRHFDYDAWLKEVAAWVDFCLEVRRINATLGELVRDKRESKTEIMGIPVVWKNESVYALTG